MRRLLMGRGGGSHGGGGGGGFHSGGSGGGSWRGSSGGHRGGGSRSSGGSFHSGPSYSHTNVHVTNYGGGGYRRAYTPAPYGWPSSFVTVFVAIVLLVLIAALIFSTVTGGVAGGLTKSTIDREPLDKQYVTVGNAGWYEDNIGWIRSPAKLEKGLKHFFDKTGVCPYLVITEEVYGSYNPSGEQCWEYAKEVYQGKFNDEGHLVFVFQSVDESDNFMMACYTGAQAKTVIDDDEALEILYDYFDSYWWSDRDEEAFFADSFADAADRIMVKTPNYMFIVCIAGVIVCGLVVVFLIIRNINKRKKEEAEETERILNTPIDKL